MIAMIGLLASCCLLIVVMMTTTMSTTVEGMPQRLIRSTINFMVGAAPSIVKPQVMNTVMRLEDHLPLPATATDTASITSDTSGITMHHPVIVAVVDRWRSQSKIGNRCANDHMKIALCIEGGGMRGCVAAGSAAAINFLGLNDAIDVVYGSSVGSMIGCYFVSRQYSGHRIYHGMIQITISATDDLYIHYLHCLYHLISMHACVHVLFMTHCPSMDAYIPSLIHGSMHDNSVITITLYHHHTDIDNRCSASSWEAISEQV